MSRSCPLCGGKAVGQVGIGQYFCRNCFVEYNSKNEVFEIREDGTLVAYGANACLQV